MYQVLHTGILVTVCTCIFNQSPRTNGVAYCSTLGRRHLTCFELRHTMKFSKHRSATCKETQEPSNLSEGDNH
jgi:hypothetical protein